MEAVARARIEGAEAGQKEGTATGQVDGYSAGFQSGFSKAYVSTIELSMKSSESRRDPVWTFFVWFTMLVIGYAIQWVLLLLLRSTGLFNDIDWIALPKELNTIDLKKIDTPVIESLNKIAPICIIPLLLCGCRDAVQVSWDESYNSSKKTHYSISWSEAHKKGEADGEVEGATQGKAAAHSGSSWRLYLTYPGLLALMFGIVIGVATQYVLLVNCYEAGRLSEFASVVFIPAMKDSRVYQLLERRRELALWFNTEVERIRLNKEVTQLEIDAVRQGYISKIQAFTSVKEIGQAQLLRVCESELARIVADRETVNNAVVSKKASRLQHVFACPVCTKAIIYKGRKGGKPVNCPRTDCPGVIDIPLFSKDT